MLEGSFGDAKAINTAVSGKGVGDKLFSVVTDPFLLRYGR